MMLSFPRTGVVRSDRALALLVVAALAGCGAEPRETTSDQGTGPLLELRLAYYEPAPGLDRVELDGEEIYVESDPVISDSDFETVRADILPDHVLLRTTLTSDAGFRLESATAGHIDQPIAIFWDSELKSAPVVQDTIGGGTTIRLEATTEEAKSIVAEVARRCPAG